MSYEDRDLDSFMESHINGGYGEILDSLGYDDDYEDYEDDDYEYDADDYDDSMDGDHDSAMESAGWGTDEDYGYFGCDEDW